MKILGGNQVVFYASHDGGIEDQLADCLEQLEEYMDENQIYPGSFIRHNIFVNINSKEQYNKMKPKLEFMAKRRFPLPMIINIIAQKPAEGDIALESTHIHSNNWNCIFKEMKYGSCQLLKKGDQEVVLGSIQVDKFPDMQTNAEKAFEQMEKLLSKCSLTYSDIVKQWSYIERMMDDDMMIQRYQVFNDVRTRYYDDDFKEIGYPASTEVGILTGGIIIEFLAVKNRNKKSKTIINPVQKATSEYSSSVLAKEGVYDKLTPTTPKLERARSLSIDRQTMVFISGTSSIIGERITAKGNVKEQTDIVIEHFNKIKSTANLKNAGIDNNSEGTYTLIKAYVNDYKNFKDVYNVLSKVFKDVPLVMTQTDLPRKNILVEIEAEILL